MVLERAAATARLCNLLIGTALAALVASTGAAVAGDAVDAARRAEQAIAAGDAGAALDAADAAIDALWSALPLQFRTITFARDGSVKGFGDYASRGSVFRPGETMTIYMEPVGYGYGDAGGDRTVGLWTGLEIRSPGGIVFARAPDFGRLAWRGKAPTREMHGSISVALPDLKPGDYEIAVDMTDTTNGRKTEAVLPFSIAQDP